MNKTCSCLLLIATAVLAVLPYGASVSDGQIVVKWMGTGIAFCASVLIMSIVGLSEDEVRPTIGIMELGIPLLIAGIMVGVHSILQITGIVSVHSPYGCRVLAGFDNPAGVASAMVVSFPFMLALADRIKYDRIRRVTVIMASCVVMAILFIARSRTGILAVGTVMLMYVIHIKKKTVARGVIATILIFLVVVAVACISFGKNGSNSGRALILEVCWNMFKDAPLLGHGLHGFRSQYMIYQADYLDHCGSSVLPMLADNITHPLNEYVLLAVNYGLLGLSFWAIGIIITIRHYIKNPDSDSYVGIMALAGIGVLSMFSYPFRYPLTVLGLLIAMFLIYKNVICDAYQNIGRKLKKVIRLIVAVISLGGVIIIIKWTTHQICWSNLSDESVNTEDMLNGYAELYPKLNEDPYFLYNYAYVLSEAGDYERAYQMATESFINMSNYDTALSLADNAKECGKQECAEEYYRLASRMCPVRFMPLYELFYLYKDEGRTDEMKITGESILSKPVKVNSFEILRMKMDVRRIMMELNYDF